ncbi:MAG: hypothetical protein ACQERN_00450 [Thermodesulfobacteriota bacterium]
MKNKSTDRRIVRLVIATGIASVVTQLQIIREFLTQFQGNEFVIALILFSWLVLGGIGTWAAYLCRYRWLAPTPGRLASAALLLAGLGPVMLMAARELRSVLFLAGSAVGFYATFAYTFAIIAPYCLLLGFLLPYSLFCAQRFFPAFSGTRIYIADNFGDIGGGALFSFVLVFFATPLQALFLANLPLVLAAWMLLPKAAGYRMLSVSGVLVCLLVFIGAMGLEIPSLQPKTGQLRHYEESRYGRIEVHQDREQHTLFIDGRPVLGSHDVTGAEETAHYPLCQLDAVENVLLISGQGGIMAEIKKYQPASVDYVEIDPAVTDVVFEYGLLAADKPLHVIHQDGRQYLSNTRKTYDAVILNLPEPDTFQVNRFFTDQFYRQVKKHLAPQGVLSFSTESVADYISEAQREKISIIHNTVSRHFENVLLLPGQGLYFLCSDQPLYQDIAERLARKKIETDYISGYFQGAVTAERIAGLNQQLKPDAPVNTDHSPRLVQVMFTQWFAKFGASPVLFASVIGAFLLAYLIWINREQFVLFTTGFMTMGAQILVIFAFQVFFGYIYFEIGLIVTVFLAGLLPGAFFGERIKHRGRQVFLVSDGVLIVSMVLFILLIFQVGDRLPEAFFLVFGFIVSLACGAQFPIALHLGGSNQSAAVKAFSADLIGAAFGTLITSVVLMPYAGLAWTAVGLILMKSVSFLTVKITAYG